jgi:hypothetical protein
MSLLAKTANSFVKTCAAAVTIGIALAPSSALAVTTWNWSFTTDNPNIFGSGTFTTADVVPAAGTTYQITGVSGTLNQGGTSYAITGLNSGADNQFRWNGTPSSPIYTDSIYFIGFDLGSDNYSLGNLSSLGFIPLDYSTGSFGPSQTITSSSIAPSTATPGPLPLLGAAAAFQASRRLRRRLSGSPPAA